MAVVECLGGLVIKILIEMKSSTRLMRKIVAIVKQIILLLLSTIPNRDDQKTHEQETCTHYVKKKFNGQGIYNNNCFNHEPNNEGIYNNNCFNDESNNYRISAVPLIHMTNPKSITLQFDLSMAEDASSTVIEAPLLEHLADQEVSRLEETLKKLETFLTIMGFNQSSVVGFLLSWTAFLLVGVAVPIFVLEYFKCSGCEEYQIGAFELDIVAAQVSLAVVSLICLSHNLRKYGIRKFLFVDRCSGRMSRFRDEYINQIKGSLKLLVLWLLPCFLLKLARETVRVLYIDRSESWFLSICILIALVVSWTYVSAISLSASVFFHLVCNLQVIHFDDYEKLLEVRDNDVLLFIQEHTRLRYYLSKISHRFRIYLLLQFLVVTASQFLTLFQTTAYSGTITVINGGDFAVSAMVQVAGTILSLHAATKISHRAQGIASLASRWHAMMTCSDSSPSDHENTNNNRSSSKTISRVSSTPTFSFGTPKSIAAAAATATWTWRSIPSETDLESLMMTSDYPSMPTTASYISNYQKRQAFVAYLQTNPGGITIYGWTVDRALITTIFLIQLSLVTFVLGNTMGLSSTSV